MPHVIVPMAERFWDKVDKNGPRWLATRCWLWTGSREEWGYGRFRLSSNDVTYAHRASYEMANGPILNGLLVCHRCDNPLCVRPSHLLLGNSQENATDAQRKGRLVGKAQTHLTDEQRAEMVALRRKGMKTRDIAEKFGVTVTTVKRWVRTFDAAVHGVAKDE